MSEEFTSDEMMVVCMSRQVIDGETVAQGLATPLVAAAYLLARHTHAPHLYFASAIGQSVCRHPAPLNLTRVESLWLDNSLKSIGFVRAVADVLPRICPKEFFRPAQIDPWGNFNNIAFGKDYLTSGRSRPRLRLPGSGGIPDVTTFISDIYLYVPRHSRVTFVPQLDVCSGLGYHPSRTRGQGPRYLVSDLGQFDFGPTSEMERSSPVVDKPSPQSGECHLRLVSFHPGVSIDQIRSHTGFELLISPTVQETPPPSAEEIRLLREIIDPLGIRRLELLSGAPRRQLLHEILALGG